MYEENRKISLADILIRLIMGVIFVLLAVWLVGLSNKDLNTSLSALTDQIFADNVDRMKEAAKGYFTTERLPQKVGEVKTISLAEMYSKKLILEVKDKYGNVCSAANSYVSVEKMDTEYQMKVYLECGEESDYIIVIMGCYDYCSTTICEKKETVVEKKVVNDVTYEYEYAKTTGGYWTEYGSWSEWSKVSVTKESYRDVETKTASEEYSYNKNVTETKYADVTKSCPSGYQLNGDGTKCYKTVSSTSTVSFNTCPSKSGYSVVQNGSNCIYTKTDTTNPSACPSTYEGYALVSQDGFNCNYGKIETADPVCPTVYGDGTYESISNFTCYYRASENKCNRVYYSVLVYDYCNGIVCGSHNEKRYYDDCHVEYNIIDTPASCKVGYTNINGVCTKTSSSSISASCPSGYIKADGTCAKTTTVTESATCPSGYSKNSDGTKCTKTTYSKDYTSVNKTCPSGYSLTKDNSKCYKNVTSTVTVKDTRTVTYYRYRLREYVGGTVDYKWSRSKNDTTLINSGYKLTGKTRTV